MNFVGLLESVFYFLNPLLAIDQNEIQRESW